MRNSSNSDTFNVPISLYDSEGNPLNVLNKEVYINTSNLPEPPQDKLTVNCIGKPSESDLEALEELGLTLASISDILTASYKQAKKLFYPRMNVMKGFEFCTLLLKSVRESLERESMKQEWIETSDVFYPLMHKRGKLVFPKGDD